MVTNGQYANIMWSSVPLVSALPGTTCRNCISFNYLWIWNKNIQWLYVCLRVISINQLQLIILLLGFSQLDSIQFIQLLLHLLQIILIGTCDFCPFKDFLSIIFLQNLLITIQNIRFNFPVRHLIYIICFNLSLAYLKEDS